MTTTEQRAAYADADRLVWDPFDGADRDVGIRARTVRIVTTAKEQHCLGDDGAASAHDIPAGTRARVERAIVEGEWGSYYICVACMDKWLIAHEIRPLGRPRQEMPDAPADGTAKVE